MTLGSVYPGVGSRESGTSGYFELSSGDDFSFWGYDVVGKVIKQPMGTLACSGNYYVADM